jgi:predicted DsbA family dithiol-disulfide isomerase
VSYELHPETPSTGTLLSDRFPGMNVKRFWERLNHTYGSLGVNFGEVSRLSNSRMSLEASEYARNAGRFDSFHGRIFRAYFTETRDIGDLDVLLELAQEEGLDAGDLRVALLEGRYASRLDEAHKEGRELGINAVPTFIINEKHTIIGAQSLDFFRERLRETQVE